MDNKNLSKNLARVAKAKGICDEWYAQLQCLDNKDEMIEMYLRGIDFCLSNDYPSNEFIRENFKGAMEKHGVFLDEDDLRLTNIRKCVCLGACKGNVTTTGFNVSEVFVKHDGEMTIRAKDNSFIMVDVFDNAHIMVFASERAKICVNRYGNAVVEHFTEQDSEAFIKIKEKNKKTY